MKLLEGKSALVTGGSRGIGKAIVSKLAEHGANVIFTFVSEGSAASSEKLAADISAQFGTQVMAVRSDISKFEEAEKLVVEFYVSEDSGHMGFYEVPDEVTEYLFNFLEETEEINFQ